MSTVDTRLDELEKAVSELIKVAKAYSIDKQNYVSRIDKVKPGVGYKIGYNKDGLIMSANPLEAADIPLLPVEKITNLSKTLDSKADKTDIEKVNTRIDDIHKKGEIKATGSVVNVDENGVVVSVQDLLPANVPELPMSKIDGLEEALEELRHLDPPEDPVQHPEVVPGIGCKVSYDKHGHVLESFPLTADDIPSIFMESITAIQDEIKSIRQSIEAERKSTDTKLTTKIDKPAIKQTAGVFYTKVALTEDGLVSTATNLTVQDIPELPISKINKLTEALSNFATVNQLVELNDDIGHISADLNNRISEVSASISTKADNSAVAQLSSDISTLSDTVSTIASSMPSDQLPAEVEELRSALSALEGRVAVLERKLEN